jgi:hypothetical protein
LSKFIKKRPIYKSFMKALFLGRKMFWIVIKKKFQCVFPQMTWNFLYVDLLHMWRPWEKTSRMNFHLFHLNKVWEKNTCLNPGFKKEILMNMVEYIIFDMFSKIWCDSHLGDQGWKLATNYHIKIDYMLVMYKQIVIWLHTWS